MNPYEPVFIEPMPWKLSKMRMIVGILFISIVLIPFSVLLAVWSGFNELTKHTSACLGATVQYIWNNKRFMDTYREVCRYW